MDFSRVCRSCLSTEDLGPIFAESETQNQYIEAIFFITAFKVEANDGYPQKICKNCKYFLESAWKFRQKFLESEHTLTTSIKPNVVKVDIEIDISTEQNIKTEFKVEEFDAEFVDFDILDEEEKSLTHNNKKEKNGFKTILDMEEDRAKNYSHDLNKNKKKVKKGLKKKLLIHAADMENRVNCKLCNKNLSTNSINLHMTKKHPGVDERRVKCELCDKYIMKSKMKRHTNLSHVREKSFRCGYCKTEFSEKQLLIDHVTSCTAKIRKRSIHDSGRQTVECDVCSKKMQKASLKMHIAVTHAGLGPVCEHCGKRFGNKLRLMEHCRARHGYEKLKCAQCAFTSASAVALQNHERRHLNEKPFVCETCGAKFHAAYLLAQHRQSHRTEKLLKCDQCPATFKANNSLHTHKRSCHSGTLHACTMCSRAYRCRHYAVRHMRHYHNFRGPVPPLQITEKTDTTDTA